MTAHSTLRKKILNACNAMPATKAIPLPGGSYMESGTPDVLCVSRGRTYLFEAKVPPDEPTPIQLQRCREWRAAGAQACVVLSAEEAVNVIQCKGDAK